MPYDPHEETEKRHARRAQAAHNHLPILKQYCEVQGWRIRVLNDGNLIEIMAGPHRYEWWPGTAKVIVNKKYERGIHCHDYQQLIRIIERKIV